jgi:hypothetical protein
VVQRRLVKTKITRDELNSLVDQAAELIFFLEIEE